jgi:hypothetical protein
MTKQRHLQTHMCTIQVQLQLMELPEMLDMMGKEEFLFTTLGKDNTTQQLLEQMLLR